MRESYHRTLLSVKRRFFGPLNISQSAVKRQGLLSFESGGTHQKRKENMNG
jgi:hypothetical protein